MPRPLDRLVLRCQHTLPKQPLLPSRSFSGPHNDPSLALLGPFPDNLPIPDSTLLQRATLVGVHMGSWPLITGGKSAASMEWKVARSNAWTFLVTQCPTCPIADLLYALVSDAEGSYQPPPLIGSPSLSLTFARPN